MEQEPPYLITDVAAMLNVKPHVVRYFCNKGLIPGVRRNRRGHRVLDASQLELAKILLQMKQAGFTTTEIRQYSRLYREGDSTRTERTAILTTRKRQLWHEISTRQQAIDFIERQEEILATPDQPTS